MGFITRQAPFSIRLFSLRKIDGITFCMSVSEPLPTPPSYYSAGPFRYLLIYHSWTNFSGLKKSEFGVDIRAFSDMGPGPVWGSGCS